ncbi:MAG: IS1 family transposase, partial [Planctomycetes bacterium]|nr:IS1 family transposase [Planctomycetota bacterium]
MSINATARFTDCDKHTIFDLINIVGQRCKAFMESEIRGIMVDDVQVDEAWQFVFCKQKTTERKSYGPATGDSYVFTALERNTKLLLCWHLGKRNQYNTEKFCEKLRSATHGRFHLSSDGFTPYRTAVPNALAGQVDFGMIVKTYGEPSVDERRKFSPPKITSMAKHKVWGNPEEDKICTSHCERMNLNLRTFMRRYTRLSNGFSKKWANHEAMLALFICHYNYVRIHGTIKTTPATATGLESKPWTIRQMIERITPND